MNLDINVQPPLWEDKRYFHPSVSQWTDGRLIMTMQAINGSDFFGPVEWCYSVDHGQNWSVPEKIASLDWCQAASGLTEGIADVRPQFHAPSQSVIGIGGNTFYSPDAVRLGGGKQHPVYAILDADGTWSERRVLEGACFEGCSDYRVACAQCLVLDDGDVLLPLYFKEQQHQETRYAVRTVRCSFENGILNVKSVGNILQNQVKRGFIEPSLAVLNGKYYLTIRAEDDCAYCAESDDGINWMEPGPWRWDTGETIQTSTTQQHWLTAEDELYLVYTRKSEQNSDVFRWRAPLYVSRFDRQKKQLIRGSEQEVFPLEYHDGVPGLLGNFHVASLADGSSLVTVGAWWRSSPYHTQVWQAHVKLRK